VVKDYSKTVMLPGDINQSRIIVALTDLIEIGERDMRREGIAEESTFIERYLDMRYRGQSFELQIPFNDNILEQFHSTHHQKYGYSRRGAAVEIVNVRIRVIGKVIRPRLLPQLLEKSDPSPALIEYRPIYFSRDPINVPFYRGEMLTPGNRIPGPAVVYRNDTTILININDNAWVDGYRNLVIALGGKDDL